MKQKPPIKRKVTRPHFDAQIFSDQGKERGRELNFAISIDRHVHADEFLISEPVRTFIAKAQWWIHVLEHIVHFAIVDLAAIH